MPETTYTVPVAEDKAGTRLDRLLADALPAVSRTRLKALMLDGLVAGPDGAPVPDPARKARAGETYTVIVPRPRPAVPRPQDIALDVVYEDADVIVVNKPAGLVVHPAPGHPDGTLVNALLRHCGDSLSGIGGVTRPGIVHRLDKDTSGLLVAAKNDAAHQGLSAQFADHRVERAYRAVVWGVPRPRAGGITGNIGRSPRNRKKMAVVEKGGKTATTHYKVVRPLGAAASLVECRLTTGRTHQIRVHLASIGHAVVGDPMYGRRPRGLSAPQRARVAAFDHQALHAYIIGFSHPKTAGILKFEAKIPNNIIELMEILNEI